MAYYKEYQREYYKRRRETDPEYRKKKVEEARRYKYKKRMEKYAVYIEDIYRMAAQGQLNDNWSFEEVVKLVMDKYEIRAKKNG